MHNRSSWIQVEKQSYSITNCFQGILLRTSWGMEKSAVVCSIALYLTSFQWLPSTCLCSSFKVVAMWTTSMVTKYKYYFGDSSWFSAVCTGNSSFCSRDCPGNCSWWSGDCTCSSSFCLRDCPGNSSLFSLLLYLLQYVLWIGGFGQDIFSCWCLSSISDLFQ